MDDGQWIMDDGQWTMDRRQIKMEEIYHIPAMLKETIEGLAIKPNGVYVDVTFGGGGHSRAILEKLQTPPQPSPQREGGRIISGITDDEKSGMASRGKEEEKEKGEGKQTREQNEEGGHLYSFDQDIEADVCAFEFPVFAELDGLLRSGRDRRVVGGFRG